jgi:hypothetical protein
MPRIPGAIAFPNARILKAFSTPSIHSSIVSKEATSLRVSIIVFVAVMI